MGNSQTNCFKSHSHTHSNLQSLSVLHPVQAPVVSSTACLSTPTENEKRRKSSIDENDDENRCYSNYKVPVVSECPIKDNYSVVDDVILGRGHFASVHLAIHRKTKKKVAVKKIKMSKSRLETLKTEIETLTIIGRHPNIVELYDIYITDTEVQLVMEYIKGGELFDRMVQDGPFSETEACVHIGKIAHALHYLHSKGIVHRDLKPENLIFTDKSYKAEIKIVDFGLSKIVKNIQKSTMMTICGTYAYSAPEVHVASKDTGKICYSYKVDLWSVGVIMYIMLSGYHPFDVNGRSSDEEILRKAYNGIMNFDNKVWRKISDSAKDLISHLINVDPRKRYGTEELIQHPWISRSTLNNDTSTTSSSLLQSPVPESPMIDSRLRDFQKKRKHLTSANGVHIAQTKEVLLL